MQGKGILIRPNVRTIVKTIAWIVLSMAITSCATSLNAKKQPEANTIIAMPNGLPSMDTSTAIYEVAVNEGVSYQDVIDSLKSVSEGMNFVNPANFPIGEHMKLRGIDPQGVKEVHSFCNLSMGTEIILDHPEFLVFAPCRIALYEKLDSNKMLKLYLGLDRPTFDLNSIKLYAISLLFTL
jgi:uncharacterized protein (DUF302 family)